MDNSDVKYKRVEEYILNRIKNGSLCVGDKIEREEDIAKKFGISQLTVNKALSNLAKEGYIHRVRGKGTFVDNKPIQKPTKNRRYFSLTEDIEKSGRTPGTRLLTYRVISAKEVPDVAEEMKLKDDDKLHYIVRIRTADGNPIAIVYNYLYTKIVPFLEIDVLENGSIWKFLAENGFGKTKVSYYSIHAKLPSKEQMKELDIDQYTPLLLSHHISVTEEGIIYNYSDTYYISDRYDYTYVTETDHSQGVAKEHR